MRLATSQSSQTSSATAIGTASGTKIASRESESEIRSSMSESTGLAQPSVAADEAMRVPAFKVWKPSEVGAPIMMPMTPATVGSTPAPVSPEAVATVAAMGRTNVPTASRK